MARREDFQTLKEYIEGKGGSEINIDMNRKHPRIYFKYRGITKFLVVGNSPSDIRAVDNTKSTLNELFNYIEDVTPDFREVIEEEPKTPSLELPQTFGERLQYAREQQQFSRERLSDLAGVDEELIQRFEVTKQESLRDFTTALKLSSALNLSLAYLVGEQTAREFKPMTTLGEAISQERQRRNMSLSDLSAKAGVPVQQLANIETGLYEPDQPKIDDIAKALQVRKEALTKETVVETAKSPPAGLYNDINTLADLAPFIRFLRERKGIKQIALASAIGMPYPGEVSKMERGIWAGGVYKRYREMAKELDIDPEILKSTFDRVIANARPEGVRSATTNARPPARQWEVPEETVPQARTQQSPTVLPENLVTAIREQAEITRALIRSQHQELVSILRTLPVSSSSPADMLHQLIDNLFGKRE